ncbi:MAG: TRIC cation channel family protein [Anaerolineae bacterium]|nr:TRIC cation channel family protein [Anaerolineae bacterium]
MDFQSAWTNFWANFGFWSLSALTIIDLIAATTNAFNGALLARRPDHYKHYTVVGILIMAILGGIGGGVARDVLLADVPSALTNPWYLILCFLAACLALVIAFNSGQKFREGLFQFMTAFSLPWYAVVGAQKGLDQLNLVLPALLLGVVGPTFGRYFIDLTSGVTPKLFVRGEWFVGTAILTSVVYVFCALGGLSLNAGMAVAFVVGFTFRMLALFLKWEEPEPWEPADVAAGEAERKPLGEAIREEFK